MTLENKSVAEATLEHYIYYLRRVEGDDSKAIGKRRAAFEEELRALLAHLERLSSQSIPAWEWPQESEDRHISQRIMRTDWLDNPETGRSYFAEARTYGDVYWLQVGYYQQGKTNPEIFASLHDQIWQPSATDHLLGGSVYLCGIAADRLEDLAAQALEAYTGAPSGAIISTRLANSRAGLYSSSEQPYVTALFYPDAESETWVSHTILNDIALRFELYKHKADRQLIWCKENYPILSEQEQSLRDLLKQTDSVPSADPNLLRRLVQLYRVYNSNVGILIDRQLTIAVNLDNLDTVLDEVGPLANNDLLSNIRSQLRQRQAQLKTNLQYADQLRQQSESTINALRIELELDHLEVEQAEPGEADLIERGGWPGASLSVESDFPSLTPDPLFLRILRLMGQFFQSLIMQFKPPQSVTYPQITPMLDVSLKAPEENLLQHVFRGFGQVFVEKEFGGGYSGTRVLLTLPVIPASAGGFRAARKVTKLGPTLELYRERDNYAQYVQDFLPFCAARVEGDKYYEHKNWAGLNYLFVGGEALGQVMDLEEYYHKAASSQAIKQIVKVLEYLLDKNLGQSWYCKTTQLTCSFAAEYGQHLAEHLRLKLRPRTSDALWSTNRSPGQVAGYKQIEVDTIPDKHAMIRPGKLVSVNGLIVKRIKHSRVKLQDPAGRGIFVGVEFSPRSGVVRELKVGSQVSVRGEVVYNRQGRMEQLVRAAFPDLSNGIDNDSIKLPGVPRAYPNPLWVYPRILNRLLEGRASYVHGDLHLRNVLVDEWGKGWLIDFARVEKRHNLFDFIKLETYIRLMALADDSLTFSLGDYVQFEQALDEAALGRSVTPPKDSYLRTAYEVILTIRRIARNYMDGDNFLSEYLPALFLYCLAVMKYYQEDKPQPTRLAFATACVLGRYILEGADQTYSEVTESESTPVLTVDQPAMNSQHHPGHHQVAMAGEAQESWDTVTIRQLLTAAFNDEELSTFCFDHFRPVYDNFSSEMGKGRKIQRLLDYCDHHDQLEKLLNLIEEHNPFQYTRFRDQR